VSSKTQRRKNSEEPKIWEKSSSKAQKSAGKSKQAWQS